ncbi:MAG: hypothetical protein RLZZ46_1108, partial [Bacteroidota bacterium]
MVNDVAIDNSNNIYVTGWFNGTVDFDPNAINVYPISGGGSFVVKLNPQGGLIWAKSFDDAVSASALGGRSLKIDSAGNILVLGGYDGQMDVNPDLNITQYFNTSNKSIFIAKLTPSGSLIQAINYNTTLDEIPFDIEFDLQNNVYFCGHSQGGLGGQDYFVVKLNNNLAVQWVKNFSDGWSNATIASCSLENLTNNQLVFSGQFQGNVDFDPGPGSYFLHGGTYSQFIVSLDLSGNFLWAKIFTGSMVITDAINYSGDVFIAGQFAGIIDFDPGSQAFNLTSYNNVQDAFILQLDSAGNFKSVIRFGSYNGDFIEGIDISPAGSIFSTGSFQISTALDLNNSVFFPCNGVHDAFVNVIHLCSSDSTEIPINSCDAYTAPNGVT